MEIKTETIDEILPAGCLTEEQLARVCSDHEPIISSAVIRDSRGATRTVSILSWNILSGYKNFQGFIWPDQFTDENNRGKRLALRIQAIAEQQNIDLICLQEAFMLPISDSDAPNITRILSILNMKEKAWDLLEADGNRAVLYKKTTFKKNEHQKKHPGTVPGADFNHSFDNRDFLGGQLSLSGFDTTLSVYSAHLPHEENPANLERAFVALGEEFYGDILLLGLDANRRVADTGAGLRDNANNLIPPPFRNAQTGSYDSTDFCVKIVNNRIEPLSRRTPHPENASRDISRFPKTHLTRAENPWRQVMHAEGHYLPVGKGMHAQVFVNTLFGNAKGKAQGEIELFVALRSNEKYLKIYALQPLPILEKMGLQRINDCYHLEFAYPGKIPSDKKAPDARDGNTTFFLRIDGKVKRCSLDGSHLLVKASRHEAKAWRKDVAISSSLIAAPIGICLLTGALLGNFVFPVLGALAGAALGAGMGLAGGIFLSGIVGLIRKRWLGALDEKETWLVGALSSAATAGLGALAGTILCPGIGTIVGAVIGFGMGVTLAVAAAWLSGSEKVTPNVKKPERSPLEEKTEDKAGNSAKFMGILQSLQTPHSTKSADSGMGVGDLGDTSDDLYPEGINFQTNKKTIEKRICPEIIVLSESESTSDFGNFP